MINELRKENGFTLIEMLMVILLVAILSAVAIPQFVDFRTEARNAAVSSAVGAMRTGIATMYGQMILRCGTGPGTWPPGANVAANDITAGGTPCTTVQISSAAERQFVPNQFPENPWSKAVDLGTTVARTVNVCAGGGCTFPLSATVACDGTARTPGTPTSGWCYDPASGKIWANSAASPTSNEFNL